MQKVTVKIDGMRCGMCEAHIRDTIRTAQPDAKRVKASRRRGEATFLCEYPSDRKLRRAIDGTGYVFLSLSAEEYKKRGLFK